MMQRSSATVGVGFSKTVVDRVEARRAFHARPADGTEIGQLTLRVRLHARHRARLARRHLDELTRARRRRVRHENVIADLNEERLAGDPVLRAQHGIAEPPRLALLDRNQRRTELLAQLVEKER